MMCAWQGDLPIEFDVCRALGVVCVQKKQRFFFLFFGGQKRVSSYSCQSNAEDLLAEFIF